MNFDWKNVGLNFLQGVIANLVLGNLGNQLKAYPVERLNGFLVRFGKAFGPPGLRHFSELSAMEQTQLFNRVPVLKTNHTDFLKPFQWIPRTALVWTGPAPDISQVIMGNVTPPLKPIPKPGEWMVLPGYLASTTIEGVHDRLGWRWDDQDQYFELSVALKHIS